MPKCQVTYKDEIYEVEYQVLPGDLAPRIHWSNPALDVLFDEAAEDSAELDAEITAQCGEHWEKHSGDDWHPGKAP